MGIAPSVRIGICSPTMGRARAASWLGFGGAALVLVSPLKLLWAQSGFGWLGLFAMWLVLICLSAWLSLR